MKKLIPALAGSLLALALSIFIYADAERAASGNASPPERVASAQAAVREPAPVLSTAKRARQLLEGMTPEEKAWQLLVVFPEDLLGVSSCPDVETWADAMHRCPVGGFVISGPNMVSEDSLRAMLAAIGDAADIPAFLCVDEEGGKVARLSYTLGVTTDFTAMYTYRDQGTGTAYANARTIAGDLVSFGFNVDFAPVADVWTNSENTVIGQRAYSDDPEEAAELVAAAVKGFQDGGVVATLKHFPGHGDTAEDSHYSCAYSGKTPEELRSCEFLPFVSGMEAGAGMVMAGHITLTEVDPEHPATLSAPVIDGLLRGELGYGGVVITDSFRMAALEAYDQAEAAAMSIRAGCDLILAPADPAAAVEAILAGVPMDRIDESVLRILTLKLESGIIE